MMQALQRALCANGCCGKDFDVELAREILETKDPSINLEVALSDACEAENYRGVKFLLREMEDLEVSSGFYERILNICFYNNDVESIKAILKETHNKMFIESYKWFLNREEFDEELYMAFIEHPSFYHLKYGTSLPEEVEKKVERLNKQFFPSSGKRAKGRR